MTAICPGSIEQGGGFSPAPWLLAFWFRSLPQP